MSMKKLIVLAVSLMIILTSIPSSVAAPTNQGLEWNVSAGDKFYYNVVLFDSTQTNPYGVTDAEEDIYVNVTLAPSAIPDDVTDPSELPFVSCGFYYLNGTIDTVLGSILNLGSFGMVKPIGNWSLMSELYQMIDSFFLYDANVTIDVDTWLHWGFTMNSTYMITPTGFDPFEADVRISSSFLKSDGVLADFLYTINNASSIDNSLVIQVEARRDGTPPVVSHPADITILSGTDGNIIEWMKGLEPEVVYNNLTDIRSTTLFLLIHIKLKNVNLN